MIGRLSFAFSLALTVLPSVARADNMVASYSPQQLVEFMVEQADLGAARALCVGTKSECAASKQEPKGFDMMLTFDLDSAELRPEARANLEVVAAALKDDRIRTAKFRVEGHTDAMGTEAYNMDLSEARALAVTQFLVERDIDPARIIAIGHGKLKPRVDDPYDPANRRVELTLTIE
ncbi:MAG: OmpA family protein [Rhizobiaceae bacterium]|jgi:outer membrane protein OmpA-like peptidoglycan-associated protein|nr:OmpA family protein [Rhizobiaceae bacterium]